MNHIYRTVFNRALGIWQVVAEIASAQGKGRSDGHGGGHALHLLALLPLSVWASLASAASPSTTSAADGLRGGVTAQAPRVPATTLPSGGTISAGSGSITQGGAAMTIAQQSQNLAINWQSFDIGRDASVTFLQPNSSAIALNRVLGTEGSQILGQLKGNGQVWVINPNGVLFGSTAQVSVGGLVASTLGLSDADFMDGKRTFAGSGGRVVNQGHIDAGHVALFGETVRNEGVIAARLGTAALAAGNTVTLDFAGDQLLNVQVDEGALHALADNRGLIQADGGTVLMTARAKDALLDTAVNNSGVIRARTVENRNGRILLLGDMDSGTASVAGTLDASAPDGGNGGFIETSAAHVKVADGTLITTRAANGRNGKWLIDPVDFTVAASGGDMTGATLSNALANGDVEIQSEAGASGVNGDVNIRDTVNWSQNTLTLTARHDINIFNTMNASGTAGLFFKYGQADAGGSYNIFAPVNLASTGSFRTQSGSAGAVTHWTIITSLGTEGSTTGTDLQGINGNLSGNYVLGADIDASVAAGWNGGKGFFPLGDRSIGAGGSPGSGPGFTGNFDGLGHVIDGLTIDTPDVHLGADSGLFAYASYANFANIGLTNVSIQGSVSAGGLVGRHDHVTVRNSYVTGSVSGESGVGGVLGFDPHPRGTSRLYNVYSTADVTANRLGTGMAGYYYGVAGGLVGQQVALIENSYSTGHVTGGNYVGGLVGEARDTVIRNSYFAGSISINGTPYTAGAILGGAGNTLGVTLENVYWNTDAAPGRTAAGNANVVSQTNVAGLTTAQMRDAANWAGFTFTTTPGASGWVLLDGVLPMLASEWSPVIRNAHQLQLMALDLNARYTLANDIDASATNGAMGDVWYGGSFSPVGSSGNAFNGGFNGNGHTIDGLTINRGAQDYVGLFGYTGTSSVLGNARLTNVDILGSASVGALAGRSGGNIMDVAVEGGRVQGQVRVGGVVGTLSGYGISDSSARVDVSGGSTIGGLAGIAANATISNSHAFGNVISTSNGYEVGGLLGLGSGIHATVSNSHAEGEVSGGSRVGGLVGSSEATITGSHATGKVTASSGYAGGLVGRGYGVIGSYATGDVAAGTDFAGGLVGQALASSEGIDGSYATGTVTGRDFVGGLAGSSTTLITDSHASGSANGRNSIGGLVGWTDAAIGNSHAQGNATGTGDYIGGLVGETSGSSATVTDSYAIGEVTGGGTVGGLVGIAYASIANSYAEGNVAGGSRVGGLAGEARGQITGSYATGDVTGSGAYVGGLVGMTGNSATVTDSHATGEVTGGDTVGGLVGRAFAAIAGSHATGNVTSTSGNYIGGLVGMTQNSAVTITDSHAEGDVKSGGQYLGGLVGTAVGTITGSYASGEVQGSNRVGGLVGEAHAAITGSHATGKTTGTGDYVGGLVGATDAAIVSSHATGAVTGNGTVGGLAGWVSASLDGSYAEGEVTGTGQNIGGLVGEQVSGSIVNAYAIGRVIGDSNAVGGLVGYQSGSITNAHATGNVTGKGIDVGGLVGRQANGSISTAYATGDVAGSSHQVGGLVGQQGVGGSIANAYASGSVTGGVNGDYVGGLVGYQSGSIENAYATGDVIGRSNYAGGLVGVLAGSITNAYATGHVTAVSGSGGLVGGKNSTGTISNSFWNTETTGQSLGIGSGSSNGISSLTGLDNAGMMTLSNFINAGWDVSDVGGDGKVWRIYEGQTAPLLRSFMTGVTVNANFTAGKTYDGQVASGTAGGYTTSTPVDASLIDGSLDYASTGVNAGTYSTANGSLQVGGLYSGQQGYDISYGGNASLTIDKAALTVTANNASKTYDGVAWSGGNGVGYSGFVNGEGTAVLGGTLAWGGNSQGAVNAGNYVISASGLSSDNYAISYVDGTLLIDPKVLTAIVGNLTGTVRKTYDGTTIATLDAGNFLLSGWVGGDGATVNATKGSYDNANAGTGKTVTVDLVAGDFSATGTTDLGNYILPTRISGNVGVIDKAAATVTAHSATVTYNGQTQGVNGYTVAGLVNGEDESVLDSIAETGGNGRNAGTYAHGVSGSDDNYALTFIDGTLTIGKATLTVGTSDVIRIYDGTTSAAGKAIVLGGRLFGDDAISGGSFAFTDKNAGTGKTVTVGGVTVDDGNGGGNYDITYASNTNSAILQKTVTIGGDFDARDKLHDGSDRATIGRNALALQGAIAGDALTVDWQAAFADAAQGTDKTVTLRGTALAGGDSDNYLLDLAGAPVSVASILFLPAEAYGAHYAGAFDAAVAWHDALPQPAKNSNVPGIAIQQCGINLPSALTRNCE